MQKYEILDYSIVKISGKDRFQFLQSIVTADMRESFTYSLLLSPQGRFLFDFFVVNLPEFYLIEIKNSIASNFTKKLMMYKLHSDVSVEIFEKYEVVYSRSRLEGVEKLYEYKDPRFLDLGFRSLVKKGELRNTYEPIYLEDKYRFAIPEGYEELLHDKSMPQEYGIDILNGISYTKGCYIGQEVISRTKYQGVIRKRIFKVIADHDISAIAQGSEITSSNSKIGVFLSGYKNLGIALIRTENLQIQSTITTCNLEIRLEKPKWGTDSEKYSQTE